MLGNNSPDSPWMVFYFLREDALLYLTYLSGRMTQMTQFVSWYCLCRLILDDIIVVENVYLWTIVVCYCGGFDPLVVIVCRWLVIVCY
jgi:hypothetical protein